LATSQWGSRPNRISQGQRRRGFFLRTTVPGSDKKKRKARRPERGPLAGRLASVFDLLWYQEMSQAEAAALLSIAVRTVKLRWMKGRLQVQQALSGAPFDDTGSAD
jgi:hypothetical protein